MNKEQIMKQFDEAIKNLKEWVEEQEPKPEWVEEKDKPKWEEKLSRVFPILSPLPMEPMSARFLREGDNIKVKWLYDFIGQEFKKIGEEIKKKAPICNNVVNEALRKRGVK